MLLNVRPHFIEPGRQPRECDRDRRIAEAQVGLRKQALKERHAGNVRRLIDDVDAEKPMRAIAADAQRFDVAPVDEHRTSKITDAILINHDGWSAAQPLTYVEDRAQSEKRNSQPARDLSTQS